MDCKIKFYSSLEIRNLDLHRVSTIIPYTFELSNSITASYPVDIVHLSKLPFSIGHASLDLWPDWCLIGPGAEGELKLSVHNLQCHEIVSIIESAIVEKKTIFHLSCKPLKKNQLKIKMVFNIHCKHFIYIFFAFVELFNTPFIYY